MDEETSEEVDQLIFSRMHFMRLTVELSYQFVILVHLSGWTALEKLCLSSEMTHVGKTTLAISFGMSKRSRPFKRQPTQNEASKHPRFAIARQWMMFFH
ncbi:uncharacterized protein LOC125218921 isoform X2 [Salvia hispanica]|uniref:uncharacterized protein LOC125218921 isoform X2 n=1 Tax=Salvia hispanica TaxID=49212 RepID=UPI002009595C|nr:uncharacterized protein LOC125218921 isoform X2 [Salvia hispanica]